MAAGFCFVVDDFYQFFLFIGSCVEEDLQNGFFCGILDELSHGIYAVGTAFVFTYLFGIDEVKKLVGHAHKNLVTEIVFASTAITDEVVHFRSFLLADKLIFADALAHCDVVVLECLLAVDGGQIGRAHV